MNTPTRSDLQRRIARAEQDVTQLRRKGLARDARQLEQHIEDLQADLARLELQSGSAK